MAKLVHDIKLIPAQHVTPFVRGDKNDHNDGLTITEESTPCLVTRKLGSHVSFCFCSVALGMLNGFIAHNESPLKAIRL
ncbi:MAG: hypothetical protein ACI9UT_003250 [Flavobacteriales bacterium]|jgi:hypothetical protein